MKKSENLPQKHFETKFPHTEIKHKLLSNTLNSSIYIANHFTEEFLSKEFVLVDLFAGAGGFDDGTKGSPIIALETITNYMKKAVTRNFNKFTLIFIEKDKENHKSLIKNIVKKFNKENNQCKMEIIIAANEWEHYNTAVQNYLDKTQAAFIFVDPFSTELKIDKLKTLIHPDKYHSLLILINLSGLERTLGHKNDKSLQKICDYFDVDEETIKKLEENGNPKKSDVIRDLIKLSLKDVEKDFVINLGIPRTSKGKLENADRFYLCLLTNSVGISDTFMKTYAQILNSKAQQNPEETFNLSSKISKIMNKKGTASLLKITSCLYDDFYSWKNATDKEVPTSTNLCRAVNSLIESGKIKLKTTELTHKSNPNKLLAAAFSSKIKQETVIVEKVQ